MIKTFTHWINEAKNLKPSTQEELKALVSEEIAKQGPQADLNHIDVSNVKNMTWMFESSGFNGEISAWDVSNVTNMTGMFQRSSFNGEISAWDVSNVEDMYGMFQGSSFNGDISAWDVSNVTDMFWMFSGSSFNGDISRWAIPLEKKAKLYSQMSSFKAYTTEELEDLIQLAMRQKQPLDSSTVKSLQDSRAFQTVKTSKEFGL